MKLEVGMYVRTDRGKIGIFRKEMPPYIELEYKNNWCDLVYLNRIVKASYKIIDLIEVEDYVNGEKVIKIFNPMFLSLGELPYVITDKNKYELQDIKSIVTKEQFESMEYEVE